MSGNTLGRCPEQAKALFYYLKLSGVAISEIRPLELESLLPAVSTSILLCLFPLTHSGADSQLTLHVVCTERKQVCLEHG
jgi:hypothetical protein